MTATEADLRTGRSLVEPELFDSIAGFTVMHFGQDRDKAERATDQALAFVATVATATVKMVPSDDVDAAFHAFILHTTAYREFCETYAGRFLEHNPRPGSGGQGAGRGAGDRARHQGSRIHGHGRIWRSSSLRSRT